MPTANTTTLSGQVAIITGASQGIGHAIAHHLAQHGMHLVLCARSLEKLTALARELAESYPETQTLPLVCDVQDSAQVQRVVDETLKTFGKINVLINNAGVALRVGLFQETTIEEIDRTIDTNLKGAMYFMRAVLPIQIQQGGGTIINVNSIAGQTAYPFWSVYDASKFGLKALTEAVAEEQRSNNIRVMGIYPGAVRTEIWQGMHLEELPDAKKMLTSDDVAEAVVYMLSQPQNVFVQDLTIVPLKSAV